MTDEEFKEVEKKGHEILVLLKDTNTDLASEILIQVLSNLMLLKAKLKPIKEKEILDHTLQTLSEVVNRVQKLLYFKTEINKIKNLILQNKDNN